MNIAPQRNMAFQGSYTNISGTNNIISNAVFTSQRITVGSNRSSWIQALQSRFDELTSLPMGWDGYLGRSVSFTNASFAANLLERLCLETVSAPSLVPGSDGTLQIEWHKNQYDIEIDVLGPHRVVASRYDHLTRHEDLVELQSDFTSIIDWISDLAVDRSTQDQELA